MLIAGRGGERLEGLVHSLVRRRLQGGLRGEERRPGAQAGVERERVEMCGQRLHRLAQSVTGCPAVEGVLHHGLAQQVTEQGYPGQPVPTLVTGPSHEQVALGHKRSNARSKLGAAHRAHPRGSTSQLMDW